MTTAVAAMADGAFDDNYNNGGRVYMVDFSVSHVLYVSSNVVKSKT